MGGELTVPRTIQFIIKFLYEKVSKWHISIKTMIPKKKRNNHINMKIEIMKFHSLKAGQPGRTFECRCRRCWTVAAVAGRLDCVTCTLEAD
jgi:hypothetical protein